MRLDHLVYRCGDCELDTANRTFSRGGTEYPLEPKVFAVLTQLVMRPGILITRDQLLDAVWGHRFVTPSTLNRVIALARRALDDLEHSKCIQTVHGAGYRYVGPVETRIHAPFEGRVRFGPPPSVRLPARLQHLVGREAELRQIDRLLEEGRSLTILGAGGMGKTQCALAFAHGCAAERFPDGIWFFDLAPKRRADEWLLALALSLSIAGFGEREILEQITQNLTDRRALLLLDNCDRLSTEVGALVVEILRGTGSLKILATSQQQLGFRSERVMRMPPLGLPHIAQPADLEELRQIESAAAVALLLERIRDSQENFKLTAENAPAIVAICERLDGMPLALELAAARFSLLSPAQVLQRLDHRFRFLVSGAAGRDHRHRTLVALLEWSFGLLSPDEQRLLAWLSVFVQGWTVEAVIDLAPAFGAPAEAAVDLLTGLADKSLVSVDQSVSPPRYRLLESVREFSLEQLKAMGEEQLARDAHLDYVLEICDAVRKDMLGARMRERIALTVPEHGNIESASEYAAGAGHNPQAALRIPGLLAIYFKAHGEAGLAIRLCTRALDGVSDDRSRERALALLCRGITNTYGIKVAADVSLLEAVSIAREVGDEWTEGYACGTLVLWLVHIDETQSAIAHLSTTERIASSSGDEILRGLAGVGRGWFYLARGDVGEALKTLRSVRNLSTDFHQHHFIGMYLGLGLFRLGDFTQAAAEWHEAMRNAIAVGHLRGISGSVEGCAYLAERLGRPEDACRFLSAAEQMRQRAGSPLFSFWVRHNDDARAALRSTLGSIAYQEAISAGARMRTEDAMNEAAGLLRLFAADVLAS